MDAVVQIFNAAEVPIDYNFIEMGKTFYEAGHSSGMTDSAKQAVEELGILLAYRSDQSMATQQDIADPYRLGPEHHRASLHVIAQALGLWAERIRTLGYAPLTAA